MTLQPTSATAVPSIPRSAFRIVLFGMPDAGKSSLLGALAQAAQTQEHVFGWKLIDKMHGLVELQRRLYEDRPRETLEEVAPFPITLETLATQGSPPAIGAEAVLFDCDGRVANELLVRRDALTNGMSKRALAQAVLNADTLVLPVDVSAESARVKRDFGQFARFLRMLERGRGQRIEVAGLPVFLVLTKCDLLAKPEDNTATWMDRIEDRKRTVHQRFQEFLAQQAQREQLPFGKIELRVWATAVKRPALADAPARPKEPYGVAELFRQCVEASRDFRQRRRRSTERLGWVLGLAGVVIGFMTILALFFLATRAETELGRFEKDLRSYRSAHNESVAERLRDPVGKTIKDLRAYKDSPLFAKMPPDLQQYVLEHLSEAEAYEKYSQQVQAFIKSEHLREVPRFAQNEAELDAFRELIKKHPLPSDYQAAWAATDIARRQRQWQDEIDVMDSEIKAATRALTELQELDNKIKDRRKYTGEQLDRFMDELKLKDKNMPYRKENYTPLGNTRVTYSNIAQFEPVAVLLARYDKIREYHKLGSPK